MKYAIGLIAFMIMACTKSEPVVQQPEPLGFYKVFTKDETFGWAFFAGKLTEHRAGEDGCGQYFYVSGQFFIASPTLGPLFGELMPSNHGFTFATDSTTYTLIQ